MEFEDWATSEILAMQEGQRTFRPGAHQSLFKHVTLDFERSWDLLGETLNSFSLSGSTPRALNDPFELSPSISDDLSSLAIADLDRLEGKGLIEQALEIKNGSSFSEENILRLRNSAIARIGQDSKYARIVSFCKRLDSPLLWSHYANKYQGACLQFIGRAFKMGTQVGLVNYSAERPVYPLSLALRLEQAVKQRQFGSSYRLLKAESDKITYFTKSIEWSYEQEVRIVYNTNKADVVRFDPIGLISIIVGPRMSKSNVERLRGLVRRSKVNELRVRHSKLSEVSFSIDFE